MTDIVALNQQILESEALKIHYFLNQLHTNHYVVLRNFQELYSYLEAAESPDAFEQLWSVGKRNELDGAMNEVTRLLLNFLTASLARVDNTRAMMKRRYEHHGFHKAYEKQVERVFKDDSLTVFVSRLRHYSVHYALPFAGGRWQFRQERGFSQNFTLGRKELLESGFDWGTIARAYLKQSDEDIIIKDFTTAYFGRIHNFQVWLENALHGLHQEELDWLYEASAQIDVVMTKIRGALQ